MLAEFQNLYNTKVSNSEFNRLSSYINTKYGIKLPPEKKVMLQSRLHKRLRNLRMTSFEQYLNYLFDKNNNLEEEIQMMNVVSTNKTDFYREPIHFQFLQNNILPEILPKLSNTDKLNIWSAGCSSGEEAYTTAFVMEEYFRNNFRHNYTILGTDISTKVLEEAIHGVYGGHKVAGLLLEIKKRYLLKSKNTGSDIVRIVPEIRKSVEFKRLNFMDDRYQLQRRFDIVFCRNVLIYFEREVQESVINKICSHLKPGGYLFLGHSESITKMQVPLTQIRPTIFQKI